MRYVNHKFGRACVHRPRREDRGKEGEREGEKKKDEREREGTKGLRRDTSVRGGEAKRD